MSWIPLCRRSRSVFSSAKDGLRAGMMRSISVCVVVSCTYCVRPHRVYVMMCSSCQPRLVVSCLSCCSCCCVSVCCIVAVMSYLVCVGCGVVGCSVIFVV